MSSVIRWRSDVIETPLRDGMRCKQRLYALAKEFMREGWQTGRPEPAPRSTTACWTYRVPRSGLVQLRLCGAQHKRRYSNEDSMRRPHKGTLWGELSRCFGKETGGAGDNE